MPFSVPRSNARGRPMGVATLGALKIATLSRSSRNDLQVRVGRLGEQVGEDPVGDAQQLGPLAAVQLVDHRREVDPLGGVRLLGPSLGGRELEVARDRVVDGVGQVLEVPPGHAQRRHACIL